MKQYTSKDQTAKLIELGFPRPQHAIPIRQEGQDLIHGLRYCIGELIEFIHRWMTEIDYDIDWSVQTIFTDGCFMSDELIDALYEACKNLRERGKI
jgi:hypothetical protein